MHTFRNIHVILVLGFFILNHRFCFDRQLQIVLATQPCPLLLFHPPAFLGRVSAFKYVYSFANCCPVLPARFVSPRFSFILGAHPMGARVRFAAMELDRGRAGGPG